ncbi:hypothetical protein [Flavobacterium sp. PS2]|uniref:hypothetical protein n=1 Tax=Flavobacterium sp. PS2 TaxID=3384157 RepID=UPI00390C9678
MDDNKVKIRRSEVVFSVIKIKKILHQKLQYAIKNADEEKKYDRDSWSVSSFFNTEKQKEEFDPLAVVVKVKV